MRRKQAEIEQLVEAQRKSGQTVPDFCREHGLSEANFYVWRQRVGRKERFVRVENGERVSLELSSGRTIRFERELLGAVLTELSR